jgi:hypothetical protein
MCLCSPDLCFVKVDIKSAFDTINQGKLLEVASEVLQRVCVSLAEDEIRTQLSVQSAGGLCGEKTCTVSSYIRSSAFTLEETRVPCR